MSKGFEDKFAELRTRLISPGGHSGALIFVYEPEEEHNFRRQYDLFLKELETAGVPYKRLPLNTLPFEVLERRNLLEKAFELEFTDPAGLRRNMAGLLHRELVQRIVKASEDSPETALLLERTASLYPWVSYSAVLDEVEGRLANPLLLPFPGDEDGPLLRLLGEKDGYNYRAVRL